MRIILATPLYPPDIAFPAPYIKELAKRLAGKGTLVDSKYEVTIVTYSDIPEEIPGVRILAVSKHKPLIYRIIAYTLQLARVVGKTDLIYAENGASVELPLGIVTFFTRTPLIIHLSDAFSHTRATQQKVYGMIERFALSRARKIITDIPLEKPEVLHFDPPSTAVVTAYQSSWNKHMSELTTAFEYGNN